MVAEFNDLRAEYLFGQQNRFSSVRLGGAAQGVPADCHTVNDPVYFRMVETARYFERNDRLINAIITRLVSNVMRRELIPNPATGNDDLDKRLKTRWHNWSTSRAACDHSGRRDFHQNARIALRRVIVDGDLFPLLLSTGRVQWMESHRCRTPGNAMRRNDAQRVPVHGVESDSNGRPVRYYFTKSDIGGAVTRVADTTPREAFDAAGNPLVLHLHLADRFTGSRGVTAFAQTQDDPGQLNDAVFATLVSMQTQSCVTFIRERDLGWKPPGQYDDGEGVETVDLGDYTRDEIEMSPGAQLRGTPGEHIEGFTPNINASEFRNFVKLLAQIISINIGVPLHMLLFDASETNFSGWRGSVEEARKRFDELLTEMIKQLYSPVYLWQLRRWVSEDAELRRAAENKSLDLWHPVWNLPGWSSIQPVDDATAATMRLSTCQASMAMFHAEQGQDWDEVFREIISSNAKAIRAAKTEAAAINAEFVDDLHPVAWFDLLPLPMRESVKVSLASTSGAAAGKPDAKPTARRGAA